MSYSISLEANVGGNVPMPLDLLDANYTYNVGGMFYEVLGHSISEWNGQRAGLVEVDCKAILDAFAEDPKKFELMNPTNGWGDFDGARSFIGKIWDACRKAPDAIVRVS